METGFMDLIQHQWDNGRFLCVGLDSDYEKIPKAAKNESVVDSLVRFNRRIIEATAEYCCAFKPNTAFYEGYGLDGIKALIETNRFIRENYPEIPVILDAKRADIGNTNFGYVKAVKEIFQAHAITVHPYLGGEALKPFLDQKDLGVIVLCHTSNPGAGEFQELRPNEEEKELYQIVAEKVAGEWNENGNCALVLGATYPEQLAEVRAIVPDIPFLIPGVGAQGGDLIQTVKNGITRKGDGIIINASRSILYASNGEDFAEAARNEAKKMDQEIRAAIESLK